MVLQKVDTSRVNEVSGPVRRNLRIRESMTVLAFTKNNSKTSTNEQANSRTGKSPSSV